MVLLSKSKSLNKPNYKLGNDNLLYIDSFTYLGITISSTLNWSEHVNSVYFKATRALNFITRNLSICDTKHKSLAYTSIVRPHLEYAAASWDPYQKNHIALLNKVPNRAARFCFNDYGYTSSVSGLIKQLGWTSLEVRSTSRLAELYKIINGLSPIDGGDMLNKSCQNNRGNSFGTSFINLSLRIDCFKFSFFPRTIRDWNKLSPHLRSSPNLVSFKNLISSQSLEDVLKWSDIS